MLPLMQVGRVRPGAPPEQDVLHPVGGGLGQARPTNNIGIHGLCQRGQGCRCQAPLSLGTWGCGWRFEQNRGCVARTRAPDVDACPVDFGFDPFGPLRSDGVGLPRRFDVFQSGSISHRKRDELADGSTTLR
ncbi:MAG: hypothetical protein FJ404_03145 [Verrucomicrobia bacterium]|nr:hypothetical protein [Verrucomicrobiota bacterium]